ncbi:unnamed protein product [Bursaphelenchus okinawaensis]|uniref:Pseudouridylate synthase 1 homolog n=1 Tax=Bursaphelenchus okinawaensis TaxID=465554 RepID=A0A811LQ61_9BILA|nr:unnamed protein product [Bursaphelenchus okinawaensis]CAG9126267.1 unnamed protein product [Bursaphelenchus okinawaensis]
MAESNLLGFLNNVKDGAVENKEPAKPRKPKKVTYAMMLSYQGKNYFGMQKQKSEATIESNLHDAMKSIGAITEAECAKPNLWWFQRAARTDRAVSAVRQICSMQLPLDQDFIDNGPSKMNALLPKDIRVMGIKRTTPSFHAQKTCDARTYSYTIPTFAFAELDKLTNWDYRINEEKIAEINDVLSSYIGTHNFFNYTSKKDHDDRSCYRYIKSFECTKPFIFHDEFRNKDVEFVTVYVKGQSFILHQIRKMMGMLISVIRRQVYKSDILKSFESRRMDVPRAPGLGLLLEKLHYDVYETRFSQSHGSLNDWGEETEEAVKNFRDEYIVSEILKGECQTNQMMLWLSTLVQHRFACDPLDQNGESNSDLREAANVATYGVPEPEEPIDTEELKAELAADSGLPTDPPSEITEETGENEEDEPQEKKARIAC